MSGAVVTVLLAAVGTLVLVVIGFSLGLKKTLMLETHEQARQAVLAYDPDARLGAVLLASDGRAALVHDDGQSVYVVHVLGDRLVVRKFNNGCVSRISETSLLIAVKDPGFPALMIQAPPVAIQTWMKPGETTA